MKSKASSPVKETVAVVELTEGDNKLESPRSSIERRPRKKGNRLHCSKCKSYKPPSEFNQNRAMPDGYHGWCRDCAKAYVKEYQDRKKAEALKQRAESKDPEAAAAPEA